MMGKEILGHLFMEMDPRTAIMTTTTSPTVRRSVKTTGLLNMVQHFFHPIQVLPDGSILKINKTVIHDTDENGNGFFFQSSVHHVFMDGEEEDEKIAGDVVVNDNEEPDMETVDEAIDETIADIISDPSKVTVLDTIEAGEDPKFNEIDV